MISIEGVETGESDTQEFARKALRVIIQIGTVGPIRIGGQVADGDLAIAYHVQSIA